MKVWRSKKEGMTVPVGYWEEEDKPDDLEEIEITKETLVCEGGDDNPYLHAGVWELQFYSENWMHCIGTKVPWKHGKYRITIEEVKS